MQGPSYWLKLQSTVAPHVDAISHVNANAMTHFVPNFRAGTNVSADTQSDLCVVVAMIQAGVELSHFLLASSTSIKDALLCIAIGRWFAVR